MQRGGAGPSRVHAHVSRTARRVAQGPHPATRGADGGRWAGRRQPAGEPVPHLAPRPCVHAGEKVVWQRTVYEAKWWTDDAPPDQRVGNEWDTPWRAVGPVLPGDARDRTPADAAGPPRWSADAVYLRGDRVRHNGFLYEAKWRTQAEEPQLDPDLPDASAWTVVGRAVEDLPPVFERYPEWEPATSYAPGNRVSLGAYVYEAERASLGPSRSRPRRCRPRRMEGHRQEGGSGHRRGARGCGVRP